MIDADLADLYGVPTKVLNQAVHGNLNCDHLAKLKLSSSLPNAFIEHGALMLGDVFKSSRAVEISLLVMRTFVQIRKMLSTHKELATKFMKLEGKISGHTQAIAGLIDASRRLMQVATCSPRPVGFTADLSKIQNEQEL